MQLLLEVSVPGSIGAFLVHQLSPSEHSSYLSFSCNCIPGLILPASLFNLRSFKIASFAPCHVCTAGHISAGGQFLLQSRRSQGLNFSDEVSFRHATFAPWDTFLHMATKFLLDPLFHWVLSLIFWWLSMARFWTLRHFVRPLIGITAASYLGIS
jgi:hypothetical protein